MAIAILQSSEGWRRCHLDSEIPSAKMVSRHFAHDSIEGAGTKQSRARTLLRNEFAKTAGCYLSNRNKFFRAGHGGGTSICGFLEKFVPIRSEEHTSELQS